MELELGRIRLVVNNVPQIFFNVSQPFQDELPSLVEPITFYLFIV